MKIKKAYEITDAKISFISLVDKAANKKRFIVVKAENGKANFTTQGKIIKKDSKSHFVTGVVYEPCVEDAHGNYMTEDEITKAAYWFAKNGNQVDLQHSYETLNGAKVVESWIAKADFEIDGETVRKGTWLMTVEIEDEGVWKAVEKGEITGFSMGGIGNYSEEDTKLEDIKKEEGERRGLLKQLASVLGFNIVEKGKLTELYNKRSTGARLWDAYSSFESVLRHYDPISDTYVYEQDEQKIKECLEEFNGIVLEILNSKESIAKSIVGETKVVKAGKAISGKNLQTPNEIKDKLNEFVRLFETEPEETTTEENEELALQKNKEESMTRKEVEQIVEEAIKKQFEKGKEQVEKANEVSEPITAEFIERKVAEAIEKAMNAETEKAPEPQIDEKKMQDIIDKAVEKAIEPILKAKALPSSIDGPIAKQGNEQHYLHGFL